MYVDIQSLGEFSDLASQGADRAADALGQLAGANVYVDVTDVTLMAAGDLQEAFAGREFVGVEIGLEGGIAGQTVMAFELDAAESLVERLIPGGGGGDGELVRSGVTEAGNIMTSGFIDGWADHLGVGIDMTPPAYVRASGTDILPDGALDDNREGVFMFESQVSSMDEDLEFTIYMLPEYAGFTDLLGHEGPVGEAGDAVPVNKLPTFNQMTKQGAAAAADNITMMTGTETDVDVSRLRFVPVQDVPSELGDETVAGTVFELHGDPSGFLAILFDEASAEEVADGMIPTETEPGIGDMEKGALRELGNIMTSGFIDGWANVLGTSIEHTPPQFVHDMGSAVMSPLVSRLGQSQDHAFIIDSTVRTPDGNVRCDIYALPDQRELAAALDRIEPAATDGGLPR